MFISTLFTYNTGFLLRHSDLCGGWCGVVGGGRGAGGAGGGAGGGGGCTCASAEGTTRPSME